ncbi:MAG: alpha/beta fold hydrolase [Clostridia bacterium]|nr:alpha/beta fold hydrolase [Clostridia bacterium]
MTVIAIVLAALVVVLAGAGFYAARVAMTARRMTYEDARVWQEDHYDISWYDPMEKTDYTVPAPDGHLLHAQLLKNPKESHRLILLSHGYTDNRLGSLKYARLYLDLGFNVIIYDLRGHGGNEPGLCTYSLLERKDLLAMIQDSRARYPDTVLFGLHGESLGAATSIAVLEDHPPVDFVVADCGFSEIEPVIRGLVKNSHIPGVAVDLVSLCAKIRYGFSFRDMRPIESLADNTIPILFIHGAEDTFIPPEHSEKMKAATKGYAELHLIPGAAHAQSVLTDPEGYRKILEAWVERFDPAAGSTV